MNFDKPKVTIDLDEYQHLKDRINGMDKDEDVIAAKKVIATLLTCNNDIRRTSEVLAREGIIFSLTHNSKTSLWTSPRMGITADDISISLIDKNAK